MADKKKALEDAYDLFNQWTAADQTAFANLLADDVVWIEGDPDLRADDPNWSEDDPGSGARRYKNKNNVLNHISYVKSSVASATRISVTVQGDHATTKDSMEVHGHPTHECVTDVIFRGDLIAQVHHCLRHTP